MRGCCQQAKSPKAKRRFPVIKYEDYPWSPMEWKVREVEQSPTGKITLSQTNSLEEKQGISDLRNQENREEREKMQRFKKLDEMERELQKRQEEIERKVAEFKRNPSCLKLQPESMKSSLLIDWVKWK